jgi:hypothetical protein
MLNQGAGISSIANATGLTRQTIYRIRADIVAAETLTAWEARSLSKISGLHDL